MSKAADTARRLGDLGRLERMRKAARTVLVSRRAPGAKRTSYYEAAKATVRPHLRTAIHAVRLARDANRAGDPGRCDAELQRAEQAITDARTDYLLLVARRQNESKSAAASAPRIDPWDRESIRTRYQQRVAAGERYGAVRDLANTFGVSETTVHNVVADLKPAK